MRIISVQYIPVAFSDPHLWLERIDFYTGIFEELAKHHEVHSFYHISYAGSLKKNNVTYHFTGLQGLALIWPFRFHRMIKKLAPDVILVQGFHHPFQVALLRRILSDNVRFFIHHHAERPLRLHKKFFQQMIDRFVKGYFFVSGEQAEEWLRANQINDRKKIHEVMECSSVYQPRDGIHVSQNNKGLVYLWVGRFDDNKDPVTLVSAFIQFARSRNVILHVIYQQNDLYEKVDAIAKGCEQIILVGKQNKEQLQQWYNNADFIVSTSHYEGSGIAVCEALSCGCIPILSSIPSFRWMAGSTGLFFQAGNENDLLTAFHKSENIDIAEARKKVIENFQTRLSFMAIASTMEKAMIS